MSDTNTSGGYTQNELGVYLTASKKLNEDKVYIGEMLMLLAAFGGQEFRRRTYGLAHLPFAVDNQQFDLGVELRYGMNALRLVVWNKKLKDIFVLQIGKNGRYPTEGIPTWLVAPLRNLIPKVFDTVQAEYGGLRNFLEDIRNYAK